MPVNKRIRFEVFKRDGFSCMYCGKKPPSVILEIDHVMPRSSGGKDRIENLITACFDCNRGKSNIALEVASEPIIELNKKRRSLKLQMAEYNRYLEEKMLCDEYNADEVADIYSDHFEGWSLTEHFKKSTIYRFLEDLPVAEVKRSMELACAKFPGEGSISADNAVKYFCGICWRKIRGDRHAK